MVLNFQCVQGNGFDHAANDGHLPELPLKSSFLEAGYDMLYAGNACGSIQAFSKAVAVTPGEAEGWGGLAESHASQHAVQSAAACYRRAVRLDGGRWHWRLAQAECALKLAESDAEPLFAALVAERGDSAAARRGLARALLAMGETALAVAEFREALVLDPSDGAATLDLARLLTEAGEGLAAVELLQPWLSTTTEDASFFKAEGRAWASLGELEKARSAFSRAVERDAGDEEARALLDAFPGDASPVVTSAYVRALFDRYAERFDRDLVEKLAYVAPRLLGAAVERVRGTAGGALRVIDLGCGSGLAGEVFRPLASHLAGVDLSARMIDRARMRGVYDALMVGDVIEALAGSSNWDLAVAADVLVYIGDLGPLFGALSASLRSGGLFAATVERLENDDAGFRLQPTRRFAHSVAYLERCAAVTGFAARLVENCVPRREKGQPVSGALIVFEKR